MSLRVTREPLAQQIPGTLPMKQVNIPLSNKAVPPQSIGERLQQLAQGVNNIDPLTTSAKRPPSSQAPPVYMAPPIEDGDRYCVPKFPHSVLTASILFIQVYLQSASMNLV